MSWEIYLNVPVALNHLSLLTQRTWRIEWFEIKICWKLGQKKMVVNNNGLQCIFNDFEDVYSFWWFYMKIFVYFLCLNFNLLCSFPRLFCSYISSLFYYNPSEKYITRNSEFSLNLSWFLLFLNNAWWFL